MAQTYPVSLLLNNKHAVVIGGGAVATRKVKGILACDARVTVIAPEITDELKALVESGQCRWSVKGYESSDLDQADIVFASTNDETVNARVFQDASAARLMVNVADRPELCNFFLPSVLRRGRLSIAVSTEGTSPLLARRIRESFEEDFADFYGDYVESLHGWRGRVNTELPEAKRLQFWEEALDGRVLACLEQGNTPAAEALLRDIFDQLKNDA